MNTPIATSPSLWNATPGGNLFEDVTATIELASNALELGQTLFMPSFTLLDAMNAIEIMDPRMDSGAPAGQNLGKPNVPPFDPNMELSPEDVIWICDRSFAAEMGWHLGSTLSQTVYTLLYVHNLAQIMPERHNTRIHSVFPPDLVSVVLRSVVTGLLKTCDLVWRQLTQGGVYDGEDFHSDKFDVSLCENFQVAKVLEMIDSALAWLKRGSNIPVYESLSKRLTLRRHILQLISCLGEGQDDYSELISDAQSLLSDIRSNPSAQPCSNSPVLSAFDPTISRRLISLMPLRVIELPKQDNTWDAIQKMLQGFQEIHSVRTCHYNLTWMNFLLFKGRSFANSQQSAFVRSLASIPLNVLNLAYVEVAFISPEYLSTLATSSGILLHQAGLLASPSVVLQGLQEVQSRLQELLEYMYTSLGQNRPRARRHFAKVLWAWHKLHEDAIQVTSMMRHTGQSAIAVQITHRLPLVIYHLRLTLIAEYIFSGFELDLYNQSEFQFIYWHASRVLSEQENAVSQLLELTDKPPNAISTRSANYLHGQLLFCQALQRMSLATYSYLVNLTESGQIVNRLGSDRQKTNMERRFDWSMPPDDQTTQLMDIGRPHWEEYEVSVIRYRRIGLEQSSKQQTIWWKEARHSLVELHLLSEHNTFTQLCGTLFRLFISDLINTCDQRLVRLQHALKDRPIPITDIEANGSLGVPQIFEELQPSHPWFPPIP